MIRLTTTVPILFLGLAAASAPAAAQVSTQQDLTAVIALHGQPCGQVTNVQKRGERDFIARCSGGQTYRVFVDTDGRTRVERR